MVDDLSCIQTAQDEEVKPSTSSTLDIGKFPVIPTHKGSWYNVMDEKYSQVVPQAFSNMAKPGCRSSSPATVQQKEGGQCQPPQGIYYQYQPMLAPQYMVQQPFFPHSHQGGCREGRGSRNSTIVQAFPDPPRFPDSPLEGGALVSKK